MRTRARTYLAQQPEQSVPELPSEIWQLIAELMGPRSWCRSAAAACKAFARITWRTMVIDYRITKAAYKAEDEHGEQCRVRGADAGQPAPASMWAPDRRRIPKSGLAWAVRHWEQTTFLSFTCGRPEDVLSLAEEIDFCFSCPAAALTELHIRYQPFPEDDADEVYGALYYEGCSAQEWFEQFGGAAIMTVCLVSCLAKMPNLKEINTTYCAPLAVIAVAGRLRVTFWWSPDCCSQVDADGAREPPKHQ